MNWKVQCLLESRLPGMFDLKHKVTLSLSCSHSQYRTNSKVLNVADTILFQVSQRSTFNVMLLPPPYVGNSSHHNLSSTSASFMLFTLPEISFSLSPLENSFLFTFADLITLSRSLL